MNTVDLRNAQWFTSSYSNGNGSCVEVAGLSGGVAARDTKQHGTGPVLTFAADHWRAFVAGVVSGGFDRA